MTKMSDLSGLMKQAQEMQEQMKKTQENLANIAIEGEAGGGLVKITMTGRHDVTNVQIHDSVMDDKEMLEDLIQAACNNVARRIEDKAKEAIEELSAGMQLPPDFKLPDIDEEKE